MTPAWDERNPVNPPESRVAPELCHALNQPLTVLRCCLDLALQKNRTGKEYREYLRQAVAEVERLVGLSAWLRELIEAGDAGHRRVLLLDACLREIMESLRPLAEENRINLGFESEGALWVFMEPQRFERALFLVLEHAVQCAVDSGVLVHADARDGWVRLTLRTGVQPGSPSCAARSVISTGTIGVAVAQRMFTAAGGWSRMEETDGHLWMRISLPLASPDAATQQAPGAIQAGGGRFFPRSHSGMHIRTGKNLPTPRNF